MSSPKTPKTPQRRRLSLKEKIKIIEDSKKPGFDKAKVMKEYGISRPTIINICEENLTGSYQCSDCDETLCVKCFKAHSRLKLTRTHIVYSFINIVFSSNKY